jgi:phosphoheptose isomerase
MVTPLQDLCTQYPDLRPCAASLQEAADLLTETFRHGGKVLICGNGGSAADADHIVGELMKGYLHPRPLADAVRERLAKLPDGPYLASRLQQALPTLSLAHPAALLLAIGNDIGEDLGFAQQVAGLARPGDLLWAISTSGRSRNVLLALQAARALDVKTLGLTGAAGDLMAPYCDILVRVPHTSTQTVQERHLPIYHALCAAVEGALFPS